MSKYFTYILFFLILGFNHQVVAQAYHFVPQPESVSFSEEVFILDKNTKVVVPKKFRGVLIPYLAEKFHDDLGLNLTYSYRNPEKGEKHIQFKLDKRVSVKDEGYLLEVQPASIVVTAKDYGGLFNGFQTLRQTFPLENPGTVKLPAMTVKDNPRFAWRGIMLDVSRHFQPKEFILKHIDVLSSYKVNKFHWHLTDDQGWRIEIKKYPNLTEKGAWRADRTGVSWWQREKATAEEPKTVGGFYTQEDIKEVIAYAKVRNVEVIPEIDVPGHSKALVASYPHLFCYDEPDANFEVAVGGKAPDNAVCAGKDSTYEFLEGVIEEVAALFPSKYLHIGGDECNKSNWKKCPYCQGVKSENNLKDEEELQSYFIQKVHKIVKAQNKTMIGWDEILSGQGAPGATIMAWRRGDHNPQITAPQDGYPTIMTSYKYMYLSQVQGPTFMEPEGPKVVLPLSKVYGHEPIPEQLTPEEVNRVLGNEACLWGEFTPTQEHCEYMLYPRALASAEVSWSQPNVKDWKRFQTALEEWHFKRLDQEEVNYANSMFTVYASYALDQLKGEAHVYLNTETVGYDIFYTTGGEDPTVSSIKYEGNFIAAPKTPIKAGLFNKEGKLLGKITVIRLK
ncbi:beta-N-acetylhexosaminidase [Arenibacter aquaticus]|uniref:beta-N-acetylhexosaminidase n=1 Tax=Arenibacter aquaticus TaxID=2489054 RepID=A0A3S0BZB2_9FLAO|nr:family 20 glycosylhydrolase [Arenibacter aquaticus]RTE55080.1 beta-N-acetylhexosaminidase [Arenibacter aquaticus]